MDLQTIARGQAPHPIRNVQNDANLVKSIQAALNRMGFSAGTPDGRWGPSTDSAYKTFAKRYGFKADEISPRAAGFILKSAGVPQPTPSPRPTPAPAPTPTRPPTPTPPQGNYLNDALRFTLKWEGGYVNNPFDYGGETNKGITHSVYDQYRRRKGLSSRSVRHITDDEVHEIYRDMYWKPSRCDLMMRSLAIVHFDTAVNFGVGGATIFLQETLGLTADGSFGPATQSALQRSNTTATARRYVQGRIDYRYLRVRQDPSQHVFLQGWLNRDNDLLRYIANFP
jgi:peptidoglycan hydrolase-like protein with peptidoglycan-binding domain